MGNSRSQEALGVRATQEAGNPRGQDIAKPRPRRHKTQETRVRKTTRDRDPGRQESLKKNQ